MDATPEQIAKAESIVEEGWAMSFEEALCRVMYGKHKFVRTGTQYGGDDERWGGEGRCYCTRCGADGDA